MAIDKWRMHPGSCLCVSARCRHQRALVVADQDVLEEARLLPLASDLDYPPSPPGRIR
jgi:hypothetical protein